MSVDFTFAQVGPSQPLYELMINIERKINSIGFVKSSTIYDVALDDRGVFEERNREIIIKNQFKESKKELQSLNGLSVEFDCREYTVYLLVCNYNDRYLNSFIQVAGKVIDKLAEDGEINKFLNFIGVVAESSKSYGGFGTFELAFEPVTPEKVISYIFNNPAGIPSLIGIIPADKMDENKVRELAAEEFKVSYSTLGFYYLEHKDLYLR